MSVVVVNLDLTAPSNDCLTLLCYLAVIPDSVFSFLRSGPCSLINLGHFKKSTRLVRTSFQSCDVRFLHPLTIPVRHLFYSNAFPSLCSISILSYSLTRSASHNLKQLTYRSTLKHIIEFSFCKAIAQFLRSREFIYRGQLKKNEIIIIMLVVFYLYILYSKRLLSFTNKVVLI